MATVRLTKHQQRQLPGIWQTMPSEVRSQLTQVSVRNIEIAPEHIPKALAAISAERAHTGCKARRKLLDALATALTSPLEEASQHQRGG